jgi:hypothetical protein
MASAEVWATLPKMTLSTSDGLTPEAISAARAAMTPRSVAEWFFRAPPKVPKAVRFAARKTMSSVKEATGRFGVFGMGIS